MIHRPIRYYYYRMLRERSSPRQLASGLAVGVFVGLAIPYGLQVVSIVAAALLFRRFNRIAALLGCTVTNPLTTPLIYLGYYRLGKWLTGFRMRTEIAESPDSETIWAMLRDYTVYRDTLLSMGLAALIFAIVGSALTYLIGRPLIARYQRRRKKRLQEAFRRFVDRARALAHGESKSDSQVEDDQA